MAVEIERKFLVREGWRDSVFKSYEMVQAYISSARGRTVRVRIRDDEGFLTIKGPSGRDGLGRFEWEKKIDVAEARELLSIAEPGRIEKTRNLVRNTDGVHTWEIDEFHGDNEGLVMAEIELGAPEEDFDRPSWLGEEVTGDRRYYNSMLSREPYKTWPRK
jgi:CYTH domain-containing protein